jgi:hypothetical protein
LANFTRVKGFDIDIYAHILTISFIYCAALTDSSVNSQTPCHVDFDPSSDFAFAPPAYDSLPKNPPTYDEICANINESFWIGENNRETPPPPPFRRASGTSADDQQQQQQPNIAVTPEPPYVEVIY